MRVLTDRGYRVGRIVKVAVMKRALPTPSVIRRRMKNMMNIQPEGTNSKKLQHEQIIMMILGAVFCYLRKT